MKLEKGIYENLIDSKLAADYGHKNEVSKGLCG